VTWRSVLFFLALVGVGALVYEVLNWYEYSTYYLAPRHGDVVIYHGQPTRLLWFRPKLVEDTRVPLTQLEVLGRQAVYGKLTEPTVIAARDEVVQLHRLWRLAHPVTTTTTTSTTTTSTLPPKAG
jgi:hypothetical protein